MNDVQYGYLVTKDLKKQPKVHNIHFMVDPVTKSVCTVVNKNSEILTHIRSNHFVTVSYYNSKTGKYTRMQGVASSSLGALCDFEKKANKAMNPQAKKTEVLVYIEMSHVEIVPQRAAIHPVAI